MEERTECCTEVGFEAGFEVGFDTKMEDVLSWANTAPDTKTTEGQRSGVGDPEPDFNRERLRPDPQPTVTLASSSNASGDGEGSKSAPAGDFAPPQQLANPIYDASKSVVQSSMSTDPLMGDAPREDRRVRVRGTSRLDRTPFMTPASQLFSLR
eukprot:Polyplicarium_translucidae@DN2310_c0_g1_i1.p4